MFSTIPHVAVRGAEVVDEFIGAHYNDPDWKIRQVVGFLMISLQSLSRENRSHLRSLLTDENDLVRLTVWKALTDSKQCCIPTVTVIEACVDVILEHYLDSCDEYQTLFAEFIKIRVYEGTLDKSMHERLLRFISMHISIAMDQQNAAKLTALTKLVSSILTFPDLSSERDVMCKLVIKHFLAFEYNSEYVELMNELMLDVLFLPIDLGILEFNTIWSKCIERYKDPTMRSVTLLSILRQLEIGFTSLRTEEQSDELTNLEISIEDDLASLSNTNFHAFLECKLGSTSLQNPTEFVERLIYEVYPKCSWEKKNYLLDIYSNPRNYMDHELELSDEARNSLTHFILADAEHAEEATDPNWLRLASQFLNDYAEQITQKSEAFELLVPFFSISTKPQNYVSRLAIIKLFELLGDELTPLLYHDCFLSAVASYSADLARFGYVSDYNHLGECLTPDEVEGRIQPPPPDASVRYVTIETFSDDQAEGLILYLEQLISSSEIRFRAKTMNELLIHGSRFIQVLQANISRLIYAEVDIWTEIEATEAVEKFLVQLSEIIPHLHHLLFLRVTCNLSSENSSNIWFKRFLQALSINRSIVKLQLTMELFPGCEKSIIDALQSNPVIGKIQLDDSRGDRSPGQEIAQFSNLKSHAKRILAHLQNKPMPKSAKKVVMEILPHSG